MGKTTAGKRICVACRVTVLSRYNPDPLCGPCARATREVSGVVPTWVWDSTALRAALARVDLAAFAVLVRRASGLSLQSLGAVVAEGWSEALMSRIETGSRDTLYDIRKLLVFTDALGMPRAALAPLLQGDPDGTLDSGDDVALREVDAVDIARREFGALAGGLAATMMLPVPQRVDRAHVHYLRATLTQLCTQDYTVGGGTVLPPALRLFTQARRMLDESDYTTAVGRELLVVTTDLGIKSAWFAHDADNQPLARRLYEQAALLADSGGDSAQCAHVYAYRAQQSTYLARHTGRTGYVREAVRFADRAAVAARHEPSPALHAAVSERHAVAHTLAGDEVAFRSAIATARRELDRGPHETDPHWTRNVSHAVITGFEAAGREELGAPTQAVRLRQARFDAAAHALRSA